MRAIAKLGKNEDTKTWFCSRSSPGGRSTVSAGAKGENQKLNLDRRSDMRGMKRVEKGKNGKRRKKGQKRGGRKRNRR